VSNALANDKEDSVDEADCRSPKGLVKELSSPESARSGSAVKRSARIACVPRRD